MASATAGEASVSVKIVVTPYSPASRWMAAIRAGDGSASGLSPVMPIWVSRYRFAR